LKLIIAMNFINLVSLISATSRGAEIKSPDYPGTFGAQVTFPSNIFFDET
jgi:hypothetical protein